MTAVLLVDGTNVVMRCAFGGDVQPDRAVPSAAAMIDRALRHTGASFLIVAFDSAAPSWRRSACPTYKAHREGDTGRFVDVATTEFARRGFRCVAADGFEADDVVATLVGRSARTRVFVLSGDTDLLALASDRCVVLRPESGGTFASCGTRAVQDRFGVDPWQLEDYKALVGEPGDNIAGVRGIGPKRARRMLRMHGTLNAILDAGATGFDADTVRVACEREVVLLARLLTTLRRDVPLAPIPPAECWVGTAARRSA